MTKFGITLAVSICRAMRLKEKLHQDVIDASQVQYQLSVATTAVHL